MTRIVTSKTPISRLLGVCFLTATLTACGGSGGGSGNGETENPGLAATAGVSSVDTCSVADINRWVDESMRDTYIYYDQVPVLNLDDYTDPAALVRDLRVSPDIYSSLVDQALDEELIVNSNVTRFGFWLQQASDGRQHFASISGNSPMEDAGIQRGDELLAINGVLIDEITDEQWNEFVVGDVGEELTAVYTIASGNSAPEDISVTKTTYTESTVPVFGTYEETNNQVGFMQVNAFRATTADEIDIAVRSLVDAGISELILDLRYNGGGFTRVARQLASQIVGEAFVDQVYSRRMFNDKYSDFNLDQVIEPQALNLNLSRLVVLTTRNTASASETLINGLAPLIDVAVIGVPTEGKPFTSVAQDFCGKRLNAMSTITTNGVGVNVLEGIQPTCTVVDDFLAPADSLDDALTGAAYSYLQFGGCPVVQSTRQPLSGQRGLARPEIVRSHRVDMHSTEF